MNYCHLIRPLRLLVQARLAALVALCCFGSASLAATVYKTVDESGAVSYSDTRPVAEGPVEVLVIEVQAADLSESVQDALDDLRETTDRMVQDRQQREQHRAELRQRQIASSPQPIEYTAPRQYSGSYPVFYPYPVRRPGLVGPRPGYPGLRPPLRPVQPIYPAAGVVSPGHDYPASLIRRSYSPEVRAAFEK